MRGLKIFLVVFICLVPILNGVTFFSRPTWKMDSAMEDWARMVLKGLPLNSVILGAGDLDQFVYSYLRTVKGLRKDTVMIDVGGDSLTDVGYREIDWVQLPLSKKLEIHRNRVQKFLEEKHPIFGIYVPPEILSDQEYTVSNGFHLQVLRKDGSIPFIDRHTEALNFYRGILEIPANPVGWLNEFRSMTGFFLGLYYLDQLDRGLETADKNLLDESHRILLEIGSHCPDISVRYGTWLMDRGSEFFPDAGHLFLQAIAFTDRAWLTSKPDPWYYLGQIAIQEGREEEAKRLFSEAIHLGLNKDLLTKIPDQFRE